MFAALRTDFARRAIVAAGLIAMSSTAAAIVFGGTNLGMFGYPKHTCSAPYSKPMKPYNRDEWSIRAYNEEVERYNREVEEFSSCIDEYLENADNDVLRIQEAAKAAVDDWEEL